MKIAIICPIGDLNRFGYWRVAQPCLESWKVLGDLFLIHSSRTAIPFGIEATYIRNENTLMRMVDGKERFDYRLVADNANIGIAAARAAGYDVAITICVNWYIEQEAGRIVANNCETILEDERQYDFLYRRFQIGGRLFNADLESIAVINLLKVCGDVVKVLVDRLEIDDRTISGVRGGFSIFNDEAYIDCGYEVALDEFKEKMLDVRNYEDILAKRRGIDWEYWERYYQARASRMIATDDVPGPIGEQIARLHPAESFGDWILQQRMVMA